MNMIVCGADCIYQSDGYCCLNFISEVSDAAVEGCHYYKKSETTPTKAVLAEANRELTEKNN